MNEVSKFGGHIAVGRTLKCFYRRVSFHVPVKNSAVWCALPGTES